MKVLTIKEPWATLIIEDYKKYEFRSWKTNYRGKLLIHAGMSLEKEVEEKFKNYNLNYTKGAILGEVNLVDCILVDENFNKNLKDINPIVYGDNNNISKYAWKLENVIKYDNPIYVKGKLGLWNYEESIKNMHKMRLNNEPFKLIKNGTKTIELRLNDEKRKLIKVGDTIEFTNSITKEKIKTKVINLYKYSNFEELYKKFDKISMGYTPNEIANYKDMNQYYKEEEQKKYGVLAIEIRLI